MNTAQMKDKFKNANWKKIGLCAAGGVLCLSLGAGLGFVSGENSVKQHKTAQKSQSFEMNEGESFGRKGGRKEFEFDREELMENFDKDAIAKDGDASTGEKPSRKEKPADGQTPAAGAEKDTQSGATSTPQAKTEKESSSEKTEA